MAKQRLRDVIARNLADLMARSPGLDTQPALARRIGVAHSQISRILRSEIGTSVDTLEGLAEAFGVQPWELLLEREEARRAIVERFLAASPAPDSKVEQHLPASPRKVVALRQRKR